MLISTKINSSKIKKSLSCNGLKEDNFLTKKPEIPIISSTLRKNPYLGYKKMTNRNTRPNSKKSTNTSKKVDKKMPKFMPTKIISPSYADLKNKFKTWNKKKHKKWRNMRKKWKIAPIMQWVSWRRKSKNFSKNLIVSKKDEIFFKIIFFHLIL